MSIHVSKFIGSDSTELTISSGDITITGAEHTLVAESGLTDDLDSIAVDATALAAMGGRSFFFILRAKAGYTITITPGTFLKTTDGRSFVMDDTMPALFLYDTATLTSKGIGLISTPTGTIVTASNAVTLTNKALTAPIITSPQIAELITSYASGAINVFYGTAWLTGGSPVTYTLANPSNPGDNGKELTIQSGTAQAHKIDYSAGAGFNGAGALFDFANFTGTQAGDSITLFAKDGVWYIRNLNNAVIAAT